MGPKGAFVEYMNDDKEWDGGCDILEVLREKAANDCILLTTRWITSKEAEIGGRHFQLCRETALVTLDLYVKFIPQNAVD